MIKDKIRDFVGKVDDRIKSYETSPEPQKQKVSLCNLVLMPIGIFLRNWKSFLALSCVFVPLMALLSFATNNSVICGTNLTDTAPFKCINDGNAVYFTFLMLRLLIIVVFLRSWYKISVKGVSVDIRNLLVITTQDWKLFATFMLILLINILPIVSIVMLSSRIPNPDWQIETLYFAVVSLGFLLPFFAIRFYSYPAFIAEGISLPSPLSVLKNSINNGLKLLLSFALILMFCGVCIFYFNNIFNKLLTYNRLLSGIIGEFAYDILLMAITAILINYSAIQKSELFDRRQAAAGDKNAL